jgi:hypothetical protein
VTSAPPLLVIEPPLVTELIVMAVGLLVVSTGSDTSFLQLSIITFHHIFKFKIHIKAIKKILLSKVQTITFP